MATIIKYKWSFSQLQIVITFEPLNRFKKTKHHCKYLQEIWSLVCTLRYFNTFSKNLTLLIIYMKWMLLQLIIFHITIPYRICSIIHKVQNGVCRRLFWWWSNDINYTVPIENNVRLYVIEFTSINMVWDSNEVDKTLFYFSWNRHTSGGYRGLNSHLWFYPWGQRSTTYITRSTIPPE